ncbi:AAA family ATPase [Seiridium cupressi]
MHNLTTALDFIEEECASTTADLNSLLPYGDILYDHIWAIFTPNSILYSSANTLKQSQAYKFSSATYNTKIRGIGPNFTITTKIVHHSGENLGWGTQVFHIENSIPDPDRIRRHLIQRGREYLSLTEKPTCREYRDFAIKAGGNNARSRARGP